MRTMSLLIAALGLLATGCASRTLVFTTYTNVGLDISAANGTPTSAVFGYKRFEGAIVPVDPTRRTETDGDAMSVYAAINLKNEWLQGLSVVQVFATGDAATSAATNADSFASMFRNVAPSE